MGTEKSIEKSRFYRLSNRLYPQISILNAAKTISHG